MKNFSLTLLVIATLILFSNCKDDNNDDDLPTPDPISLVLTANISEGFQNPILSYNDENGDRQTENLSTTDATTWEKTMTVEEGYQVYLEFTGIAPIGSNVQSEIIANATQGVNILLNQNPSRNVGNSSVDIPVSLKVEEGL